MDVSEQLPSLILIGCRCARFSAAVTITTIDFKRRDGSQPLSRKTLKNKDR
jgi:hypothetical protein